ncbi:hypothetical protein GOBAR_AA11558 [Gossypium barbadense]|uniref:Uncharacterized protein n=1 Tax=Gossypium barbadense TaxID=3634 RepID=A0A2P5Y0G2_GOSBA|nr:hypothetical protein GOBAR_AA11558 [Gossypium barbadense]
MGAFTGDRSADPRERAASFISKLCPGGERKPMDVSEDFEQRVIRARGGLWRQRRKVFVAYVPGSHGKGLKSATSISAATQIGPRMASVRHKPEHSRVIVRDHGTNADGASEPEENFLGMWI